ncbi:hypothetical protein Slin_6557 [Spirosoma linguale DSM 74]|uniref:Uncharacterized protein n=2 Tax=Spirosoma TaxID=107 RepID=D2QUN2_SPILD|nr:hypothetical protein Slin_6557 [Spirosoma linguale DSM 74]
MNLLTKPFVSLQLTGVTVRWLSKIRFLRQTPKSMTFRPIRKKIPGLTDDDYYYTPEGYVVFTAAYHLKRGYCCKSGCRHCPYGFKKKVE